ncbi:MAG: hypothetical protein XU14_C0047G0015, partial [Armatimonadetes bacterium CSP1-3]
MLLRVAVGVLDPGNASDHVRVHLECPPHVVLRPRVAEHPLLGEGDHAHVHHPAPLVAQAQERLYPFEAAAGVGVRGGVHVADAVLQAVQQNTV